MITNFTLWVIIALRGNCHIVVNDFWCGRRHIYVYNYVIYIHCKELASDVRHTEPEYGFRYVTDAIPDVEITYTRF